MIRFIVFVWISLAFLYGSQTEAIDIRPSALRSNVFEKIKILDQKELNYQRIDGQNFAEISDLAYNRDSNRLYMIGDEGSLYVFDAKFEEKIKKLRPLYAREITKENGKPFRRWQRDSEGLAFGSRGGLLISFEGEPRLGLFDYEGEQIKNYPLPPKIAEKSNYRSSNKMLEALACHPRYGAMVVSEWSLKNDGIKYQTVYSLGGKEWHFQAQPEEKSAVTAVEIMDDGNLLVLERSFINLFLPLTITLKKVILKGCQNKVCPTQIIAKMSSADGWDVDNFEGLAKVGKNRYIMISDDNDSFLQKTILIYFEVIE